MRMKQLNCEDSKEIKRLLSKAQTGFLGLALHNNPYIVPLNYVWHNDHIYFHGANEGMKMDILRENTSATFVVMENEGTMVSPIPAKTDTAYTSIMLFGQIEFVEDLEEATEVMQALLNKYVPGYYHSPLTATHVERYRSPLGSKTVVCKLMHVELTAKKNVMVAEKAFYPGRTITDD